MLGRDTEGRQGDLLTDEQAHAMGWVESLGSNHRVVLISHDCDLPNDTEVFVEVIVGSLVQAPNPMLANARNPRRLHLKFVSDTGVVVCVELSHFDRKQAGKANFARIGPKDVSIILPADEKRALKQWLAARYGRPAFPNAFENRLRKSVGVKTVQYRIAKTLAPEASHLVALFFDLMQDRPSSWRTWFPIFSPSRLSTTPTRAGRTLGPVLKNSPANVARALRQPMQLLVL